MPALFTSTKSAIEDVGLVLCAAMVYNKVN